MPSNNIEIEQAVLGSLLLNVNAYPEVDAKLTAEDFVSEVHSDIYKCIKHLAESGKGTDYISVSRELDRNNLPSDWKYFIRVQSDMGPYQKNPTCHYELDNSGKHYTDKWSYEEMTDIEKQNKIEEVKSNWSDKHPDGLDSWAFDEDLCRYEPPIPRPKDYDGQNYGWNEAAYQAGYAADAWYFISDSEN